VTQAERELLVCRIASGTVRLTVPTPRGPRPYVVRPPTRDQRYRAAEVYAEVLRRGELDGLFDDDSLMAYLVAEGLWDEDREALYERLPRDVEDAKAALYRAVFKASERQAIRKALGVARAKLADLSAQRGAYDHLTAAGAAAAARNRYLLAATLHTGSGRPACPGPDPWGRDARLLDAAAEAFAAARVPDPAYRELARTEPWRGLWALHKSEGSVFGVPPADLTDEQRALAGWSALFENVYQHPDCPSDEVLADDDLMDGWLVLQRRDREARAARAAGDELLGNEKIRNSQEVYLVAETPEDARRVLDKNDAAGKAAFRQRMGHLKAKGRVSELEMPDTARRLRMEVTQRLAEMSRRGT
jgi:hypothetical protein